MTAARARGRAARRPPRAQGIAGNGLDRYGGAARLGGELAHLAKARPPDAAACSAMLPVVQAGASMPAAPGAGPRAARPARCMRLRRLRSQGAPAPAARGAPCSSDRVPGGKGLDLTLGGAATRPGSPVPAECAHAGRSPPSPAAAWGGGSGRGGPARGPALPPLRHAASAPGALQTGFARWAAALDGLHNAGPDRASPRAGGEPRARGAGAWRSVPSSPRALCRSRRPSPDRAASGAASASTAWPAAAQARPGQRGSGSATASWGPGPPSGSLAGSPTRADATASRQLWSPGAGWPSPQAWRGGIPLGTAAVAGTQAGAKPPCWPSPAGRAPPADPWPPLPWATAQAEQEAAAGGLPGGDGGLGSEAGYKAAAREAAVLVDATVRLYDLGAAEAFQAQAGALTAAGFAQDELAAVERVAEARPRAASLLMLGLVLGLTYGLECGQRFARCACACASAWHGGPPDARPARRRRAPGAACRWARSTRRRCAGGTRRRPRARPRGQAPRCRAAGTPTRTWRCCCTWAACCWPRAAAGPSSPTCPRRAARARPLPREAESPREGEGGRERHRA